MAEAKFEHVTKRFGDVTALSDLTLTIDDGEFLVLVGPSGCGKSTALRCLAGLEEPDEGRVFLDDVDITYYEPKERDIAMVFQNYAIYPHMKVRDNIGFPLKMRKVKKREIQERVLAIAQLLDIDELLNRKPRELSGGQRQRVALARAIVRSPRIFLMDEPLSNLDAQLRVQTRTELTRLHRQLGTTTIYVTHDQVEAMTMGTRIAVMNDSELQQVATPAEVYSQPANMFVASFIGSPPMNLAIATIDHQTGTLQHPSGNLQLSNELRRAVTGRNTVVTGIRPEHLLLEQQPDQECAGSLHLQVEVVESVGSDIYVHNDDESLIARLAGETQVEVGDQLTLKVLTRHLHLFDSDTGDRIGASDPETSSELPVDLATG